MLQKEIANIGVAIFNTIVIFYNIFTVNALI